MTTRRKRLSLRLTAVNPPRTMEDPEDTGGTPTFPPCLRAGQDPPWPRPWVMEARGCPANTHPWTQSRPVEVTRRGNTNILDEVGGGAARRCFIINVGFHIFHFNNLTTNKLCIFCTFDSGDHNHGTEVDISYFFSFWSKIVNILN